MSVLKAFNVKLKSAAVPLGEGRPHLIKMNTVARAYSIDINMSPHCTDFADDVTHQKSMIVSFLVHNLKFISQADIYAENNSYRRDPDTHMYAPYGAAKLHWHGIVRFHKEFDNRTSVEYFMKKMREKFSSPSATSTFRAVFYKKIRNSDHLYDRTTYQTKQVPLLIEPIKYSNEISF